MKYLLIFVFAVAATQALPGKYIRHSKAIPREIVISEVEGAPQYTSSRITTGTEAERGQFPYQAALYLTSSAGTYFCGGSLISQRWVLTAAHCAKGISSITVYLGAHNLNAADEEGRVIVQTTVKSVHSRYIGLATYDIALVDLVEDVPLSEYIQPIQLATGDDTYNGATARASGWGRISDAATTISPVLNYADVTVISNTRCLLSYGVINVRDSIICTKYTDGKGVCKGDSGGPLVDLSSGKQIGIVNFVSSAGCESGSPGGYARVTSYIDWISKKTGLTF